MPFLVLVILFVAVPVVEISLLIRVGGAIGAFNTIVFVIFTAVLGAYLVKQQGMATLAKFQQESSAGRIPAQQMMEGIALLIAGAVLLTPGFFTDAIGFALLVPPLRQGLIAWFINSGVGVNVQAARYSNQTSPERSEPVSNGSVIEGEYTASKDDSA